MRSPPGAMPRSLFTLCPRAPGAVLFLTSNFPGMSLTSDCLSPGWARTTGAAGSMNTLSAPDQARPSVSSRS